MKIWLVASLIKVKFRVRDGDVFVDCPESGEISAEAWCPFCSHRLECWGDDSWEEIASKFNKHEGEAEGLDEKLKRYVNETLGFKSQPRLNGGGNSRREE